MLVFQIAEVVYRLEGRVSDLREAEEERGEYSIIVLREGPPKM